MPRTRLCCETSLIVRAVPWRQCVLRFNSHVLIPSIILLHISSKLFITFKNIILHYILNTCLSKSSYLTRGINEVTRGSNHIV